MKGKSYAGDNTMYYDNSTEELELARELLAKSIALDSSNVDAQIQFARSHYYHDNFDIAIPILEKLVKYCERTSQGKLLGRAYRNLGNVHYLKWSHGKGVSDDMPSLDHQKKAAKIAKEYLDIVFNEAGRGSAIWSRCADQVYKKTEIYYNRTLGIEDAENFSAQTSRGTADEYKK